MKKVVIITGENAHNRMTRVRRVLLTEDGKPDIDITAFVQRANVECTPFQVNISFTVPHGVDVEFRSEA